MAKYYLVQKDTFLWKEGAIISNSTDETKYLPIEDIWNKTENQNDEYISKWVIEDKVNKDYFKRVYKVGLKGMIFRSSEYLIDKYKKIIN